MGDNVRALLEGAQEGTVWECGAQQYVLEKVVGNGAFGIVWRARSADGEVVAIKKALLSRTRRLALGSSWVSWRRGA